ncbi:MAG: transposase [Acidobacteria bacterium]|nr:transposase [Acidobacteriota bacterium]
MVPAGTEKRRRRSVAERRQIVEETLLPGASVARVARAHGVNANQVFYWRALYRRGRLGGAALVAVTLADTTAETMAPALPAEPVSVEPGTIHIQFRTARVRIEGRADPAVLRAVLEALGG